MKSRYLISCAVAALVSGIASAQAQQMAAASTGIESVVVSADRRDESAQTVPMTLQAFSGNSLQDLNVEDLQDLLKYTPNISYGNNGPGQGEIFMRGLSNGFRGNQSTGTVGLYPNVAIYLDEQSMQFPARNVDIYMVDMQRVEVLEGPQGTLFGGGAEAGALRYITNKPDVSEFSGKGEVTYSMTSGGAPNTSAYAVLNFPILKDQLAVRLVLYDDQQGGYINNVYSQFTRSDQDPGNVVLGIHPNAAGVCPDGGTNAWQQGGMGWCTLKGAPIANNSSLVGRDQNPVTHQGARVSALYDLNDDWNVLIGETYQKLDAEGLSVEYPIGSNFQTLSPLEVTAFAPSFNKDDYSNTAWTVNGKIGDFSLIYTGGWTTRHIDQQMEYSNYSRTYYGVYYSCSGGGSSAYSVIDQGGPQKCNSPVTSWRDTIRSTHLSNEFRVSTPGDWRIRGIAGAYYEEFRIYDNMNFNYKTIPDCNPALLSQQVAGEPVCLGNVETYPGATANQPGVRSDSTAFGEDTQRGYNQTAFFGSVDYDIIPKVLTLTAGTRWFQYREFELGSVYTTGTGCENVLTCFASFPKHDLDAHNDHKTFAGFKSRLGLNWNVTDDIMAYYLFSEGFRPGGFNRYSTPSIKDASGSNQWTTPNSFAPDSLQNQEIGIKSELLDHNLQLNLSAYDMRWNNVQFLFFQPTVTGNTTFATNGPTYDIKGVELQFVARPADGVTLQGSATFNDNIEAKAPCLVGNIPGNASFGQCITEFKGSPYPNPFGVVGGRAAFSPEWQGNALARYDWSLGDFMAFAQTGVSFTGGMYNQPANYVSGNGVLVPSTTYLRYYQPAFATVDAAFGITRDKWRFEIFGENLSDNHASTFTSSAQWIKSQVPLRPLIAGVKLGFTY